MKHHLGLGALVLDEAQEGGLYLANGTKAECGGPLKGKICAVQYWQSVLLSADQVQDLLVPQVQQNTQVPAPKTPMAAAI